MRNVLLAVTAMVVMVSSSLMWAGSSAADPAGSRVTEKSADVVLGTYNLPGASSLAPTTEVGPFGLGPLLGPGEVNNVLNRDVQPPCQDCDITSVTPDLTDVNGASVNVDSGPMLHHMVLYQEGAADVSCPGPVPAFGMKRLFAAGNERTPIDHAPGYGLYIEPAERFAVLADLMNYSAKAQTVQIRLHVTYVPGHTLKALTPVWLDETGCGFSYMTVPPGPSHQSTTWTSTLTGKVIGLGGHLHEYGLHIQATDATTHTPLCDSQESQMTMDNGLVMVTGMSRCLGTGPDSAIADIHRGDTIQMDSYYNAPTPKVLDAMGIMMMYVAAA